MKGGRGGKAKGVSCERSLDGWEPSRHPFPSTPPIDDIRFLFHCISIAGGNALLEEGPRVLLDSQKNSTLCNS